MTAPTWDYEYRIVVLAETTPIDDPCKLAKDMERLLCNALEEARLPGASGIWSVEIRHTATRENR